MNDFHRFKIIRLEAELKRQKERLIVEEILHRDLKNKIEENKVLLNFHKDIIAEAAKEQQRKEYKIKECRECDLGIYGACESGYEDVLYCKELQKD